MLALEVDALAELRRGHGEAEALAPETWQRRSGGPTEVQAAGARWAELVAEAERTKAIAEQLRKRPPTLHAREAQRAATEAENAVGRIVRERAELLRRALLSELQWFQSLAQAASCRAEEAAEE